MVDYKELFLLIQTFLFGLVDDYLNEFLYWVILFLTWLLTFARIIIFLVSHTYLLVLLFEFFVLLEAITKDRFTTSLFGILNRHIQALIIIKDLLLFMISAGPNLVLALFQAIIDAGRFIVDLGGDLAQTAKGLVETAVDLVTIRWLAKK